MSIYRPHIYILTFIISFCIPSFIYGYLGTSGRVFVDSNGDTVQLRGFGLGGWLVQEGYMWNTSGFYGSTSVIEQKIKMIRTKKQPISLESIKIIKGINVAPITLKEVRKFGILIILHYNSSNHNY